MKKIIFIMLSLWFTSTFAEKSLRDITLQTDRINANYISVYLVTGRQGIGNSFVVGKVYDKLGTFKVEKDISFAARELPRDGWRGPSHLLVVTHQQPEHALNRFNVMGTGDFVKPSYFDESDFVAPTEGNTKFISRMGKLISTLNSTGVWKL